MSSTLLMCPELGCDYCECDESNECPHQCGFRHPVKGMVMEQYFGNESPGDWAEIASQNDLPIWEGFLKEIASFGNETDTRNLERMVASLRDGGLVTMWFVH